MKTEELLRYQAMYRAMKERFQVRFIEYGFDPSDSADEGSPPVEADPGGECAQPAEDGSRRPNRL